MHKADYKIIENEKTDFLKSKIIQDYWCFEDFSKFKYTYTVETVGKRNFLRNNEVVNIVRNTAHLEIKVLLNCKKCYGYLKFYVRSEISGLRYLSSDDLFCETCYRSNVNQLTQNYLSDFKKISIEKAEVILPKHNNKLSYLEKIFIYTLVENPECLEKGYVPEYILRNFESLEAQGMDYIINSLIDKKYLFKKEYKNETIKLYESIKHVHDYESKYLLPDLKENIKEIAKLDIANHLYINIPEKYNNIKSWLIDLHNEIMNSKLDVCEIKEIESYIIGKRLVESINLLHYISSYKKIPVSYDNALELEILRMNKNFDLNYCYSLLNYQSQKTTSYLYENSDEYNTNFNFKKQHMYRRNIHSYLNYLESKNEKPKFPKKLPDDWEYSEIEIFVSKYIIKNYKTWEGYTPSEILELWLGSVDKDIS